jgi:hypothetical protein
MRIISMGREEPIFWEYKKESESEIAGAEYERPLALTEILQENLIICAHPSCTFHSRQSVALIYILLCVWVKLQCADLICWKLSENATPTLRIYK